MIFVILPTISIVHDFHPTPLTVPRQLRCLESVGVVVWLLCDLRRRPEEARERLQRVQERQQLLPFSEVKDLQLSFVIKIMDRVYKLIMFK